MEANAPSIAAPNATTYEQNGSGEVTAILLWLE